MQKLDFHPKSLTCLRGYNKTTFMSDLMAGVIVGIVALPLAIAFAIASGVSPEKGIITALPDSLSHSWEEARFRSAALPAHSSSLSMVSSSSMESAD